MDKQAYRIPVLSWNNLSREEQNAKLERSEADISRVRDSVQSIIDAVRTRGDSAVRDFTREYDHVDLENIPLEVQDEEFELAEAGLEPDLKAALDQGIDLVRRFHANQLAQLPIQPSSQSSPGHPFPPLEELAPGLLAGETARPIPSAGLYIPRGKGSFPSMLYMLALPAALAGVPRIAAATPPGPDGSVDAACLYTARRCGVHHVYRAGGAQAIAALAWGTETIQPVSKIEGPGSFYVSAARRLLSSRTDAGMPAGPSEAIILADHTADPGTAAADLIIEAEHGGDSSALLITPDRPLAEEVSRRLPPLIQELPSPRREFVQEVLTRYGGILLVPSLHEAVQLVNRFAPEHLMIQTEDPRSQLSSIWNAGEILLGKHTPFSAANYACGVNAVLPTGGRARTWSAVSVRNFIKYSSVVEASKQGLEAIGPAAARLAEYEGFPAHAAALHRRLGTPE